MILFFLSVLPFSPFSFDFCFNIFFAVLFRGFSSKKNMSGWEQGWGMGRLSAD